MQQGIRRRTAVVASAIAGTIVSAGAAVPAQAATIDVPCGNVAALRAAITNANAAPGPDTIVVAGSCDFVVTNAVGGVPGNTTGMPTVLPGGLRIAGNGSGVVRPAGAPEFRHFLVAQNAVLELDDFRVTGGRLTTTGSQSAAGAGIYNFVGSVVLRNTVLSDNDVAGANSTGGGLFSFGGATTLTDSTIQDSSAVASGGGLGTFQAPITLTNSTLRRNAATSTTAGLGVGGGVALNAGALNLTGSSVEENSAGTLGGGIYTTGSATVTSTSGVVAANTAQTGAGLYANGGGVTLHGTPVQSNVASFGGGGIAAAAAQVVLDEGAALRSNTALIGGGAYATGGRLTIAGGRVETNTAAAAGGVLTQGTETLVSGSQIAGNRAVAQNGTGFGGGIYTSGGTLAVETSTVRDNEAFSGGAGVYSTTTQATIRRSTLRENRTPGTSSAALVQGGTVLVENSTVHGNTAQVAGAVGVTPAAGGAPGRVDLVATTVTDNGIAGSAAPATQIAVNGQGGPATLHATDTIVSDSDAGAPISPACIGVNGGQLTDGGGNLEWPQNTCGFGTVGNPLLAPLADNGGPTATRRPLPGSAAIDLGGASCPPVDQRGATRPQGEACDSGAFETPAPDTMAQGPAQDPTADPSVTFSSPSGAASFQCRVGAGDWTPCTSPYEPDLGSGTHTVHVRAVDAAGYWDRSPASVTFTVDRTAPVVDITGISQVTGTSTARATFTVDGTAQSVQCQVDDGPREDCTSPYITGPLGGGTHTLTVYASDALGNEGSDSQQFALDETPPDTTITGGPSGRTYGTQGTFTFSFTSTEPGSSFECRMDTGPWQSCTSPHTVSGVAAGWHTFAVRATDANGNVDPTPATRVFDFQRCSLVYLPILGTTVCL